MKKFYQTEWQGIQFCEFAKLSSNNLAGPEFYQAFYDAFFKRYQNWGQLPSNWGKEKERCAEFVLSRKGLGSRLFSIGCGLGAMEHYMHAQAPQPNLFIHEVAPSAWRWIGAEFPEERKFLGLVPACLPDSIQFDLVYLSAVDYALDDDALVGLLAAIRPLLIDADGKCMLISASFQDTPTTLKERVISLVRELKTVAAAAMDACGVRSRGQFWGWSRTQKEYQSVMRRAGYCDIEDGFIDPDKRAHYWIAGR